MIWKKDSVHVPRLLFISGCSLALRAHHFTATSRADRHPGGPSTSNSAVSALETSANLVVETSAAGEGMKQPGSRKEMAVLKSQLQIKAGSTLCAQLVLGLRVQDSCQEAKFASRAETVGNRYRSRCMCQLVRPALQSHPRQSCVCSLLPAPLTQPSSAAPGDRRGAAPQPAPDVLVASWKKGTNQQG